MSEPAGAPSAKRPQASNLTIRVITGLVIFPVISVAILLGGWVLSILLGILAVIGVLEFFYMRRGQAHQGVAWVGVLFALAILISFHLADARIWQIALLGALILSFVSAFLQKQDLAASLKAMLITIAGNLYVTFPLAFLIAIRQLDQGLIWIIAVFLATWGTDTLAYFGGRAFGRHKLAPRLSPKKTIEGAIFGLLGGTIPTLLLFAAANLLSPATILLCLLTPPIAILGDLFESWLKRRYVMKDSGIPHLNIFPGHGGVLDRIDALIFVSAFFFLFLSAFTYFA